MPTALTIAGSDSGGGAGIQADLKTFAALGVYGTSAITALTAQNTRRVTAVHDVEPGFVGEQIEAIASDIAIDAVKTGMLANALVVQAVVDALTRLHLPRPVVDPVMVAKSGDALLAPDAVDEVRRRLLPLAAVVTPNRMEAEVLTGRPVRTRDDAREAARALVELGAGAAVIKGGHFDEPEVVDLLFDGRDFFDFRHARQDTRHTHGTGCTFAAAIAAHLALGRPLPEAVAHSVDYVAGAIRHGLAIGHGHGPVDHFWSRRG
ncbi:MAG TPA: bifunctional hydroxymethylpyrimidine kinase/phosphomethylpyrimidine kinase [Vicinamibacterales bacterium]